MESSRSCWKTVSTVFLFWFGFAKIELMRWCKAKFWETAWLNRNSFSFRWKFTSEIIVFKSLIYSYCTFQPIRGKLSHYVLFLNTPTSLYHKFIFKFYLFSCILIKTGVEIVEFRSQLIDFVETFARCVPRC